MDSATNNLEARLDIAPQARWRYSHCRHRICHARQSSATEFQKYFF